MTKSRIKKSSFLRGAWARYKRNKPALIGLGIIAVVIFLAVFADILAPYEKMALAQHADLRFLGPSKEHLLGTDAFGRDSFARLIHGARWSLAFGFVGATLSFGIGCVVGAAMALIGGWFDEIMTKVLDILISVPSSILLISLVVSVRARLCQFADRGGRSFPAGRGEAVPDCVFIYCKPKLHRDGKG